MIPVCAAVVYSFYKGANFTIDRHVEELKAQAGLDDFASPASLLAYGIVELITYAMAIFSCIVLIKAGIKTMEAIRRKYQDISLYQLIIKEINQKSGISVRILLLFVSTMYLIWFIFNIIQGNIYFLIWSILILAEAVYYSRLICRKMINEK